MTYINYLTFAVITQEPLNDRRSAQQARLAEDAYNTVVDPELIGLVKKGDVDYEVPAAFGHVHSSTEDSYCSDGRHSCYNHAMDLVHPTDN